MRRRSGASERESAKARPAAAGSLRGVELGGLGSTTFRRKAKRRGAEPDECYVRGAIDSRSFPQVPELVIEVAISPWRLDRLAIYGSLGVKEVWLWQDETLKVFALRAGARYSRARRSVLGPRTS